MTDKKIKVYSSPTCPHCNRLKDFLKKSNVDFDDMDVTEDEKAREEMVEKSSQMGVPVIDIDGDIIIGFNKEKIKDKLNL
ncbi:MAG: glutaredoxin domain-containing protein [Elusimicrobiota bacterium]